MSKGIIRDYIPTPTLPRLGFASLGGGFNPFEKYARQLRIISPRFGVNIPKIFELPPPSSGLLVCWIFHSRFLETSKGLPASTKCPEVSSKTAS